MGKHRLFIINALFGAVLLLAMNVASAATYKIGVIDINKVLENTPHVAAMKTKLQNQFAPKIKEITALNKTMQADVEKYNKDGAMLKAKERDALQSKIVKEQQKLQQLQSGVQQNFMQAQNQAQQTILQLIQNGVTKIAAKENYDLVFVKDTVAFNLPAYDITDQVIAELKK